jgi:hypothetical protein
MRFDIPCKTFIRIANAAAQYGEFMREPPREFFRAVRLEHRNGLSFACATNGSILAVELLGNTDEPDGSVNVTIIDPLIDQCRIEETKDSILTITEAGGWAVAQTTLGYFYPDNASVPGDWPLDWRILLNQTGVARGAIAFDAEHISRLGLSSPSGQLVFPKIETMSRPVIVNDPYDPDWIGAFMAIVKTDTDPAQPLKYAVLRDWAK